MERDEATLAALESAWHEVVEAVMAGRGSQSVCPECGAGGLNVDAQGNRVSVSCGSCGRVVEVVTRAC